MDRERVLDRLQKTVVAQVGVWRGVPADGVWQLLRSPDGRRTVQGMADGRDVDACGVRVHLHLLEGDVRCASEWAELEAFRALDMPGDARGPAIARAWRHRGLVALAMGHPRVATQWFQEALRIQHDVVLIADLLSALIADGRREECMEWVLELRETALWTGIESRIHTDFDLRLLRDEGG